MGRREHRRGEEEPRHRGGGGHPQGEEEGLHLPWDHGGVEERLWGEEGRHAGEGERRDQVQEACPVW